MPTCSPTCAIGGKAVPASDGGRFDVLDPATGAGARLGRRRHRRGRAGRASTPRTRRRPRWAATRPARARRDPAPGVRADDRPGRASWPDLISLENGKALPDARGEVAYAAEFFRWYAEEAVRGIGAVMTAPSGANRILVLQPAGRASACWSRRGTSRPRWRPARSGRRWRPAAPSSSSRPATPR